MRTCFRTALLLAACFGLAAAQNKPNFSGEWKMNAGKSNYGMVPKPDRMLRKIEHAEPNLRIVSTQAGARGETTNELKLVIDGKEHANKAGNAEVKSTLRWEGAVLCIDSKRPFQAGELVTRERWTLSADGNSLNIQTRIVAPMGETDITLALDKQ